MTTHQEHLHNHGDHAPAQAHAGHAEHEGHHQPSASTHAGHGGHEGHDKHAGHNEAMFRDRFWLTLLFTIPVLIYSEMIQHLLGFHPPAFPGSTWIAPVLSSVIFWWGGWPFLKGAADELHSRQPGMMTLVAMAISTAFVLPAWVGAVLMSLSAIVVAINAQTLRRLDLRLR